jgi:hypothetical protein
VVTSKTVVNISTRLSLSKPVSLYNLSPWSGLQYPTRPVNIVCIHYLLQYIQRRIRHCHRETQVVTGALCIFLMRQCERLNSVFLNICLFIGIEQPVIQVRSKSTVCVLLEWQQWSETYNILV